MFNVLFYEDDFPEYENVIFVNRLVRTLPKVRVHKAGSFAVFESMVDDQRMDAMILDIMGAETTIQSKFENGRLSANYIGIEMLRRVRAGHYSNQDPKLPIVMRTARAGEVKIKALCMKHSVSAVWLPGQDDQQIIEFLANFLKNRGGS